MTCEKDSSETKKKVVQDRDYSEIFSDEAVLKLLLIDRSSKKNIIWATDTYLKTNPMFTADAHINVKDITGKNINLIKPRAEKTKFEQDERIRDKGEVFTPSWVCNEQNNLVDESWFGYNDVFNTKTKNGWKTKQSKVIFPEGKDWKDYITLNRIEITCGEAPYLVSRYDTVSGNYIEVKDRIGLLDRKLRVISENVTSEEKWCEQAFLALKSIYGYDWQGDNVFIARKNVLLTVLDFYCDKFGTFMNIEKIIEALEIISWNIWQMDGFKFVIPGSCHKVEKISLLEENELEECPGCISGNCYNHNGIYCSIMDWKENKCTRFVDIQNFVRLY